MRIQYLSQYILFFPEEALWFLICFWNVVCLPWENLFSQLRGKLGGVMNNCLISTFWTLLLVHYFWWITVLPAYSTHSILLTLLLNLPLFSVLKPQVTKPHSGIENLLYCYLLWNDFSHSKVEHYWQDKSPNKKKSWKGKEEYIMHIKSYSFILFCHITMLIIKALPPTHTGFSYVEVSILQSKSKQAKCLREHWQLWVLGIHHTSRTSTLEQREAGGEE